MINYKIPEILRGKIALASDDIRMIDREENIITIFPDYVSKRTNTIASGVVIESTDSIYPCAVPDLGCSFHVVELEGLFEDDLKQCPHLFSQLDLLLSGKATPLFDANKLVAFQDMILYGHDCTAHLFEENRGHQYENGGRYEIDGSLPFSNSIFPKETERKELNEYQGHFMEILVSSDRKQSKVYLLIHSGCHLLAERFKLYYYPLFAKMSYKNHWSNKEQVISGKFRVPIDSGYEKDYFNNVNGLLNFTIAYRDIVEHAVVELIRKTVKKEFKAKLLSDYSHTKISLTESGVIHQRGIQYLESKRDNLYVMSGFYGVKSMLFSVETDGFYSHGSQANIEYLHDDVPDANEMVAYEFLNDAVSEVMLKQAKLAKLCYDFCLSLNGTAVDFLRPVYSFKID